MNQRKRVWSLLLAVLLLLSACQKSDPAPKEDTMPEKQGEEQKEEEIPLEPVESFDPASYTNAMMLEDYDFFWTTLEENCAPLGALREVAGADLDQWKEEYRQQVAALPDGDAEGFVGVMNSLSGKFGSFAHIYTPDTLVYHRYMDVGEYFWESETQKELFQSDKVRAFYQWQDSLPRYQKQLEAMKENDAVSEDEDGELTSKSISSNINLYRQGDTAVAMIKTFRFYGADAADTIIDMLQEFCLENLDAKDFIIDITRNGGGDSNLWYSGFEPLWAGKTFTENVTAIYKAGAVNVQMWDGWPENDPDVELKELSDLGEDEYPQLDRKSLENCDGVATKTYVHDFTDVENPNKKEFNGRIWLLVDSVNFSSSEMFVQFAKDNDIFTLVGTQTAGGGCSIAGPANMDAAMPNCGMLVRFSPFYFLNEDGTCNDLEGTHPDIEIESGETAMQRCLKEIKKLQK